MGKLAGGVGKNADKVDTEADKLHTTLTRLLLPAQTALELVDSAELGETAASANGQSHGAA